MFKHPLKVAICSYLLAMYTVADAQVKDVNVPLKCLPSTQVFNEYNKQRVFKPFMLSSSDDTGLLTMLDPSDGELHTWLIVGEHLCLVGKTMLERINIEVLSPMKPGKEL